MIKIFGYGLIKLSELADIKKTVADIEVDLVSLKHQVEILKKQLRDIYT